MSFWLAGVATLAYIGRLASSALVFHVAGQLRKYCISRTLSSQLPPVFFVPIGNDLFTPFHIKSRSCQYNSYWLHLGTYKTRNLSTHLLNNKAWQVGSFPAMSESSPCISGSPQAFPRLQCSYFNWECSRGLSKYHHHVSATSLWRTMS